MIYKILNNIYNYVYILYNYIYIYYIIMQYKTTVLPQWQKKCQHSLPYHCVSRLFVGVASNYTIGSDEGTLSV